MGDAFSAPLFSLALTYLTYGGDNLIQLLLLLDIHSQLTAFSHSILFFSIEFDSSVALSKAE